MKHITTYPIYSNNNFYCLSGDLCFLFDQVVAASNHNTKPRKIIGFVDGNHAVQGYNGGLYCKIYHQINSGDRPFATINGVFYEASICRGEKVWMASPPY